MRPAEHHSPAFAHPVVIHEERRPIIEIHEERRPIVEPPVVVQPDRLHGMLFENVSQQDLDQLLGKLEAKGYTVNRGDHLSGVLTHHKFLGHFSVEYGLCDGHLLSVITVDHQDEVRTDIQCSLDLIHGVKGN